jgi:large subunit ribosomal protein L19
MQKRLPKLKKSYIIVFDFERSAAFFVYLGVVRNYAAGYERFVNNGGKVKMKGLIEAINAENLKPEIPQFNVGDTVKVGFKIIEGGKERVQNFEGVVIAKKNGSISETFTVRHISYGVGVEKTYPLHSPKIASITVVRKGKVRRAKLYYLRSRTGKAAKVKERI